MTNVLVGDVYDKIIQEVINSSTADFEESGISQSTLQALQQEWRIKLSTRGVAQMPWDPKPVQQAPAPPPPAAAPSAATNGLSNSYNYNASTSAPPAASTANANGNRVKHEPTNDAQFAAAPNSNANNTNGYAQSTPQPQGGLARAQQLVQAQYGPAASASLNAMQRGGLALPGQQAQAAKPQGLHLPQQSPVMQQQQSHRVKTENDGSNLQQGMMQQTPLPNYSQTDGAADGMTEWKAMLAARRAISDDVRQQSDHLIRDQVMQLSEALSSGLMVPLDEHRFVKDGERKVAHSSSAEAMTMAMASAPVIRQLDGVDEDDKADLKDEDDENAINSDLDDDSLGGGPAGEDDEDLSDEILCTYDKVQRVKNKWKCTLKDGIMAADGKDWVFHKGMGEFEW